MWRRLLQRGGPHRAWLSRVLRKGVRVGVAVGSLGVSGCASIIQPPDGGRYERRAQVWNSYNEHQSASLYEVISNATGRFDASHETAAGLQAHQGCRTNAVFNQYHVRFLYDQLKSRFSGVKDVTLVHENGYIYVAMPISDQQPDVRLLTRLGTALSGNEKIHLFIPGDSPFGYNVDRNSLKAIRASLSRSGVDKDHVLLLPMETFGLPADLASARQQVMPVKICYG